MAGKTTRKRDEDEEPAPDATEIPTNATESPHPLDEPGQPAAKRKSRKAPRIPYRGAHAGPGYDDAA